MSASANSGSGARMTGAGAALIEVEGVSISYKGPGRDRARTIALESVTFSLEANSITALLGPSGCGKTSLINAMAGFIAPSTGSIQINGERVVGPSWHRGVVFQDHALFPWLTVRGNIEFGPIVRHRDARARKEIVDGLLDMVGLSHADDRYPSALSGGMRQRVGIARALANSPEVLLLDEPFGSLDAITREELQEELLHIWEARKVTIVFVTHSVEEAVYLADRILIFSGGPGRLIGDVRPSIARPRDRGSANFAEVAASIRRQLQ